MVGNSYPLSFLRDRGATMAKKIRPSTGQEVGAQEGIYAYPGLDRSLHERARLGIMTSLIASESGALFNELKALCELTDGNLKRHLDVLVDEGLVAVSKTMIGNRSQSLFKMTTIGRRKFLQYLEELQHAVDQAKKASSISHTSQECPLTPRL